MKKLILASCLSAICINSYALESNVIATIEKIPAFAVGQALAIPQNAHGKVGQTINVSAMYQYNITNTTNSWQNYVGVEKLEVNGKNFKNPIAFSLPPHGSKKGSDLGTLKYPATATGKFTIKATIAIAGNPGAGHSSNATLTID